MPYQANGWWPTNCTNQFNEASTHRNTTRKEQEEKNLMLNQNNQVISKLFKRIPKHQVTKGRAMIKERCTGIKIGVQSMEIPPIWKEFSALLRNFSLKLAISLDTSLVFVTRRSKHPSSQEDQRQFNTMWKQYMCKKKPYATTLKITVPVIIPSACRSRCSAHKLIQRSFPYQLTL